MRIGFVTGEYPPMEGGVGAFTHELATSIHELGNTVAVFTRRKVTAQTSDNFIISAKVGNKWGWRTIGQVRDWAKAQHLDVVNIQYQTAAFNMHAAVHWLPQALRRISPCIVVTFHDLRTPYLFPKAGPVRGWVIRKMACDASGCIMPDRGDFDTARNEWHASRSRRIPIGSNVKVDVPSGFDRSATRTRMGIGRNQILIGYFGFLNESKGAAILVDSLAEVTLRGGDIQLLMIGGRSGDSDRTNEAYSEQVDERIAKHNLQSRIHWSGFVNNREVSELFLSCDIVALPYLDGVSLRRGTLMAALAHGRAIITTKSQREYPELDNAIFMVNAGDSHALANGIIELSYDREQRTRLERAALQASRQFVWSEIAYQTLDFYGELLAAK